MTIIKNFGLFCIFALATASLCIAAPTHSESVFVRGFVGEPNGGFRQLWHSYLGDVLFSGVRKNRGNGLIEWKTAIVPRDLAASTVTFVWAGAMGIGPSNGGDFTISINGKDAVDFDVVMQPTEFPGRDEHCRLVFNVMHAPAAEPFAHFPKEASGIFYLTTPKSLIEPGQPAAFRVRARDKGSNAYFALLPSGDVPLAPMNQVCKVFKKVEKKAQATPPPAGEEASYEWYRKQYHMKRAF